MLKYLKLVLADVASLANPATALALLALIAQLFPGVSINGTLVAGVLGGVGVLAGFVQRLLVKTGYNPLVALEDAISDIVLLRNPATAAAMVMLVVQLIPGVSINGQLIAGILTAVGVVASFVAAQVKLANTPPPAPAPVPAPVPVSKPTPPTPSAKRAERK